MTTLFFMVYLVKKGGAIMDLTFKNFVRDIYEHLMLNIYVISPALVIFVYFLLQYFCDVNLLYVRTFNQSKITYGLSVTAILFTIMGLFSTFPNTNFMKLLKKYGHNRIVLKTLLFGIITSLSLVILSIFELFNWMHPILFLIATTELVLAVFKIYNISKYINR